MYGYRMRQLYRRFLPIVLMASDLAIAQMAALGEPLKESYQLYGQGYEYFYNTYNKVDSYSIICDMGQAIPDKSLEQKWYTNKPIPGLRLELRARLAVENSDGTFSPMGFIVIVKSGDVLKVFKPIGDFKEGEWSGDAFNSWSGTSTDIEVFSERFGVDGYASFDLIDGMGFYYKSRDQDEPSYFLSNCRRIKKIGLPVYDWKFK